MGAEPLVLSGSSLQTYRRCPKWWRLEYLDKDIRPPSLKAARGLAAHTALEVDLQARADTGAHLPREQVLQTYIDAWTRESEDSLDPKQQRQQVYHYGLNAVAEWYDKVAPTIEPVLVEVNGQFVINGVHYEWTADLLDKAGVLRDHKFTARRPTSNEQYELNMLGYYIGLSLDHEVSAIQVDWMVCNTKPYHWPLGMEYDERSIDRFGEEVRTAYDLIMDGFYPARPNRMNCSWCPFSDGTCKEGS
jgi:hypothetical protein